MVGHVQSPLFVQLPFVQVAVNPLHPDGHAVLITVPLADPAPNDKFPQDVLGVSAAHVTVATTQAEPFQESPNGQTQSPVTDPQLLPPLHWALKDPEHPDGQLDVVAVLSYAVFAPKLTFPQEVATLSAEQFDSHILDTQEIEPEQQEELQAAPTAKEAVPVFGTGHKLPQLSSIAVPQVIVEGLAH